MPMLFVVCGHGSISMSPEAATLPGLAVQPARLTSVASMTRPIQPVLSRCVIDVVSSFIAALVTRSPLTDPFCAPTELLDDGDEHCLVVLLVRLRDPIARVDGKVHMVRPQAGRPG